MRRSLILFLCVLFLQSCQPIRLNVSSETSANDLIKDCPEEMINNQFPGSGKSNVANQYYIYKGIRKEIREFDSVWVREHCKVKVTLVQ